jgi:hypothetical protein
VIIIFIVSFELIFLNSILVFKKISPICYFCRQQCHELIKSCYLQKFTKIYLLLIEQAGIQDLLSKKIYRFFHELFPKFPMTYNKFTKIWNKILNGSKSMFNLYVRVYSILQLNIQTFLANAHMLLKTKI